MATVGNTVSRSGKVYDTKFTASLEGGPQLAAALRKLSLAVSGPMGRDAVRAGLDVIRQRWAAMVPEGNEAEGDRHPGAYQQEMSNPDVIRVGKASGDETTGLTGVKGTVGPRTRPGVAGIDKDDQPAVYATVLEFGGYVGRDHATFISPQGTARAAFDASSSQAADAVGAKLKQAIASAVA